MFLPVDIIEKKLAIREEDPTDLRVSHLIKPLFYGAGEGLDELKSGDIVLLGYPDDRGVARNGGRLGASEAPDAIRSVLYKMTALGEIRLWDLGNLDSWSFRLEEAHEKAAEVIQKLREKKVRVVSLGGGHDWAYSDFLNYDSFVLNFDAHLDMRPAPEQEDRKFHSGTPFRRLIEASKRTRFGVVGLQRSANSLDHLNWAEGYRVPFLFSDELEDKSTPLNYMDQYFEIGSKAFSLSVDMDVFSQADAPGVSAPSSMGVAPQILQKLIRKKRNKVEHLGIYELCPRFDLDKRTARLAAQIVHDFIFSGA